MRTEIPKMTYEERLARAQAKKDAILGFLASGEVYTCVAVAAQVMAVSPSAAERSLASLVRNGSFEAIAVCGIEKGTVSNGSGAVSCPLANAGSK